MVAHFGQLHLPVGEQPVVQTAGGRTPHLQARTEGTGTVFSYALRGCATARRAQRMDLQARPRDSATRRDLSTHIDHALSADTFQRRERTRELRADDRILPLEAVAIGFGGVLQPALSDRGSQPVRGRNERLHLLVERTNASALAGEVRTYRAQITTVLTARTHGFMQPLTEVVALTLDSREQVPQPTHLCATGFECRRSRTLQVGVLGFCRSQHTVTKLDKVQLQLVAQAVGLGAQPHDLLGRLLHDVAKAGLCIGCSRNDALELLELGEVNIVCHPIEIGRSGMIDAVIGLDARKLGRHDRREPRRAVGIDASCFSRPIAPRESNTVTRDLLHPHRKQRTRHDAVISVTHEGSARPVETKEPGDTREQLDDGDMLAHAADTAENLKAQVAGDLIDLEVTDPERLTVAAEKLGAIAEPPRDGLPGVEIDEQHVRGRVQRAGRATPGLLRDLEQSGITLESIEVHRPTLDDVFLTLTGRSLRDAEDAAEAGDQSADSASEPTDDTALTGADK